ncbi:hypothetical protein LINPERHAP2_LOCUS27953 [Linum perenne]
MWSRKNGGQTSNQVTPRSLISASGFVFPVCHWRTLMWRC